MSTLENYTSHLIKKIKDYLALNQIDTTSTWSNVNNNTLINFVLIHQILSRDNVQNFQISIPCEVNIAGYYESILWATIISKYAQNLSCNSDIKEFEIDDRLYCPKKHKIYHYRGVEGNKIRLADKNSITFRSISDLNKMFILNANNTITCHTTTYFRKYYEDFLSIFPNVEVLTKFTKKTVIVVSKEFIDTTPQKKTLPIRYNLEKDSNCLVEPLIEVINDFSAIEGLLWTENHGIEDVIFLGKNKYKDTFLKAIEHQSCGRIKKVILLGEQSISNDYQFLSWHWTTKELFYLKSNNEKSLIFHPINSPKILEFVSRYSAFTEKLINAGANSEYAKGIMYQYLVYFLIPPLINTENSPLTMFLEKLHNGSSDFEILLDNAHIEIIPYITALSALLTELHELLITLNPKLETIKSLSNNKSIKVTYVVVKSRKSAKELKVITEGTKGLKVLTHQELKAYLKRPEENGLFNQEGNLRRNHFIFTHLHLDHDPKKRNPLAIYRLYEETLQYGLATVLYYDSIEANRINKITFFAQEQTLRHLIHPDRSYFVDDLIYEEPTVTLEDVDLQTVKATQEILALIESGHETTEESDLENYTSKLHDYFAKYFGEYRKVGKNKFVKIDTDEDDFDELEEASNSSKSTLKNETKFEIIFDDNSSINLYTNQIVACKAVDNDSIIGRKVEELKVSDKIIDYNITFDNSSVIFETIPEAKEPIRLIQQASGEWRNWLKHSRDNYKLRNKLNDDDAAKVLHEKLQVNVSLDTVKRWLTTKEKYYFPRDNEDLDKILQLRIRQTKKEEATAFISKAEKIKESRNTASSFKEVITQLKIELTNFLLKKEKGDVLSRITNTQINELLSKKQFKNIIKIQK